MVKITLKKRHFIFITFLFITILCAFMSCKMTFTEEEYADIASEYLLETYGINSVFVSQCEGESEDEIIVSMETTEFPELEGKIIKVQIKITDRRIVSANYEVSSNYPCVMFFERETAFYEDLFKTHFSDCKVIINNENRFVEYDPKADIGGYFMKLGEYRFKNYVTVIVTDNDRNTYLDSDDKLKGCLWDFQNRGIHLDGLFYIVRLLNERYDDDNLMKVKINVYEQFEGSYIYNYEVIKKQA